MVTRQLLSGLLAMTLIFGVNVAAKATRIGGGGTPYTWGSIDAEDILQGLGNAEITLPAYGIVLLLQEASVLCVNPAGHFNNQGVSFNPDEVSTSQTVAIDSAQVTKNGRALAELSFSDGDLIDVILALAGNPCNNNWTPSDIAVTRFQGFATLFSCDVPGGDPNDPRNTGCEFDDAVGKQCVAPAGTTLDQLYNGTGTYSCTTICEDPGTPCPQPPHELPSP